MADSFSMRSSDILCFAEWSEYGRGMTSLTPGFAVRKASNLSMSCPISYRGVLIHVEDQQPLDPLAK
jgi:hypothetical protein